MDQVGQVTRKNAQFSFVQVRMLPILEKRFQLMKCNLERDEDKEMWMAF